jgi:hypothetical protein
MNPEDSGMTSCDFELDTIRNPIKMLETNQTNILIISYVEGI